MDNAHANILESVAEILTASITTLHEKRKEIVEAKLMTMDEINSLNKDSQLLVQLIVQGQNDPSKKKQADMLYDKLTKNYEDIVNREQKKDGI